MVVEVALHDRLEPLSGLRNRVVRAVVKCCLISPSLARIRLRTVLRFTTKVPSRFFPQICVKPRKSNVSGFLLPVWLGVEPELNPARFVRVQLQTEIPQPFPEIHQEPVCVIPILEAKYVVVGISHNGAVT